jgi:hypothetical protein
MSKQPTAPKRGDLAIWATGPLGSPSVLAPGMPVQRRPRVRLRRLGHLRRNGLLSVISTTSPSVMAGMAISTGHRICSWPRDKVPILRKHRVGNLVCTTQARLGCGHATGLAACFSTSHQPGFEAGEHPVWVSPLSHRMTYLLYPNTHRRPQLARGGCALAPRGFPGPSFGPCPDCRTPFPAYNCFPKSSAI